MDCYLHLCYNFEGEEDQFGRLSSAVGTPEADQQKVVEEEVPKNEEREEESEKAKYDEYYRNGDELNDAVQFLMEL